MEIKQDMDFGDFDFDDFDFEVDDLWVWKM